MGTAWKDFQSILARDRDRDQDSLFPIVSFFFHVPVPVPVPAHSMNKAQGLHLLTV